jgi:hypothetical protein
MRMTGTELSAGQQAPMSYWGGEKVELEDREPIVITPLHL